MQFVHSLLAIFGCRFEHRRNHAFDFPSCGARLLDAKGEQRQHCGRRMSDYNRPWLQLRSNGLARLALDPRRANRSSGFIFQGERKIDDGIAKIPRRLPVVARRALIGSEESKIHFLELLRAHALDKTHLVTDSLQPPKRLLIIKQADIDGGEIPFAQNFGNLFPLERCCTHNSHAINIRPAQIRRRGRLRKREFWSSGHGFCDASRYAGGDGGVLRWKIHCRRHSTPEAI